MFSDENKNTLSSIKAKYTITPINSSANYVRSNIRSKRVYYTQKATAEYIENLKNTHQCKRMWIQNEFQISIMATFSRGRLANQLSSFALQYAIWKVKIQKTNTSF